MFLLDGLAVCCKPRGALAMYRLKEKINLRHVKLADLEETESAGMMRDVQGQRAGRMYAEHTYSLFNKNTSNLLL